MKTLCTEERFLKGIAGHVLTIQHDDGIYRCLRLGKPGDSNMYFTLTTWPWHLCISGDMGTFVFNRIEDMFTFFRVAPERTPGLHINPSYWGEKCEAADRRTGGMTVFSEAAFKSAVAHSFKEHTFDNRVDKRECWEAIKNEVLCAENEHDAQNLISRFRFTGENGRQVDMFPDFWERDLTEYSYHYLWCCYAIAWGIKQYDAETAAAGKAS
jgi:hypothetical protein